MTALALFTLALATCGTAALAAFRWVIRPAEQRQREARVQQRTPADVLADAAAYRARRIAELEARANGCHIDDDELADHLAIWTADYQAGCDRLRDEINKQQKGEET